jgi:hypothetical protein
MVAALLMFAAWGASGKTYACFSAGDAARHTALFKRDQQIVARLTQIGDDCSPESISLGNQRIANIKDMLALGAKYSCPEVTQAQSKNQRALRHSQEIVNKIIA